MVLERSPELKIRTIREITASAGILIFLTLLMVTSLWAAQPSNTNVSDYGALIQIGVTPSTVAWDSETWLSVQLNTGQLYSASLLQEDADDMLILQGSTRLEVFAQDVTSNPSTTWVLSGSTLNADSEALLQLYVDASTVTRDQAIGLQGATENIDITDSASLDITTNITLESLGTTFFSIPTATSYVLRKDGAYELGARNGNEVFSHLFYDEFFTPDFLPDGDSDAGLSSTGCASDWQCVNDDSDATYVYLAGAGPATDEGAFVVDDASINAGADITQVRVRIRGKELAAGCGVGSGRQRPFATVGASTTYGGYFDVTSAAWSDIDLFMSTKPGGGSWTIADFNNLIAGVGIDRDGCAVDQAVSEIDVQLSYTLHKDSDISAASLVEDAEVDILSSYDGTTHVLKVDGTTVATDTFSQALLTTSTDVLLDELTGTVGQTRVGGTSVSSPVYVLDLDYEADNVTQTQAGTSGNGWTWLGTIEDQSASNNDGTYTFERDIERLTEEIGSPILTTSISFVTVDQVLLDVVGDVDTLLSGLSSSASSNLPFESQINAAADAAGLARSAMWILWVSAFALFFAALTMRFLKLPVMALLVYFLVFFVGILANLYPNWVGLVVGVGLLGIYSIFRMNRTAQL